MSQSPPDKPDKNDKLLFQEAMEGVKPIPQDKVILKPKTQLTTKTPAKTRPTQTPFILSETAQPCDPEELLHFSTGGLREKTLKKLRKGLIKPENVLDLHGCTIDKAANKLQHFINNNQRDSSVCVLLIHGRGHRSTQQQPVLKQQINYWLRNDPRILAFESAIPRDGGAGALYVLLRKRSDGA